MPLDIKELPYFVRFVLLDEATRQPSRRQQTAPLAGYWMQRTGSNRHRASDRRQRCFACMLAYVQVEQLAVSNAAAEVVAILGLDSKHIEELRTGYYEAKSVQESLEGFYNRFLHWREWALRSPADTIQSVLNENQARYGTERRETLSTLLNELRTDSEQLVRHREWLLTGAKDSSQRIQSGYKLPEHWFLLASDLSNVGRIYAQAHHPDALSYFQQALEIWQTHGLERPHEEREEALTALQVELQKLRGKSKPRRRKIPP